MFSIHELYGMLNELGLGNDNKILFMRFRILGMSLDDGLVPLMADAYVIKLLDYVPTCKEIEVYIESGVSLVKQYLVELLVSHSQSKGVGHGNLDCDNDLSMDNTFSFRNLMQDSYVEIHNVAIQHENVDGVHEHTAGDIHEKMQNAGDIHEKVQETRMDDDLFQQDSVVDLQHDAYNFFEQQESVEMVVELNHPDEKVFFFQTSGAQVDPRQDIDEEVVDANLEQSRMDADKIWKEFGADVIDFDHFHSCDEGDDKQPSQTKKRILMEIRREFKGMSNIKEGDFL
ncbi:hypothetical protein Tco_0138393 [Tanacetum coccineum]